MRPVPYIYKFEDDDQVQSAVDSWTCQTCQTWRCVFLGSVDSIQELWLCHPAWALRSTQIDSVCFSWMTSVNSKVGSNDLPTKFEGIRPQFGGELAWSSASPSLRPGCSRYRRGQATFPGRCAVATGWGVRHRVHHVM